MYCDLPETARSLADRDEVVWLESQGRCQYHQPTRKMNRDEKSVLSVVLFLPLVVVSPVAPSENFALDVVAVGMASVQAVVDDDGAGMGISKNDRLRLATLLIDKGTLYTRAARAWRQHAWRENIRKALEGGVRRTTRMLAIEQPRPTRHNTFPQSRKDQDQASSTEEESPRRFGRTGRIEDIT